MSVKLESITPVRFLRTIPDLIPKPLRGYTNITCPSGISNFKHVSNTWHWFGPTVIAWSG